VESWVLLTLGHASIITLSLIFLEKWALLTLGHMSIIHLFFMTFSFLRRGFF
jgi:hypothetical protein